MEKIIFQNGPEGKTPLNKTNMNKLQDNVENEFNKLINALSNNKETVTGENITVNDSAEERIYEFNISGNSKQEKREGYNLIGLKDGTYTFNGITAVVLNGEATLSGTATTVTFASIPLINEITLKQSTLYQMYVFNNTTTDAVVFRPNETDGNRQAPFTSINNVVGYQNNQASVTLTKVTFRIADGINLSNIKCKPMIIEGSNTTLAYEQYGVSPSPDYPSEVESCGDNGSINEIIENEDKTKSQTFKIITHPLRSVGEVRDTFEKVNGKWFQRHYTNRVIFNGTESWQNVQGYGIFYINNINNLKPNTSAETLMGCVSNCFKEIVTSEINAKKEGFCVATTNRLYFFHNGFSPNENLEGFKAWLQEQHNAGTPVYVDYILATPNDVECTTEQIVVLDEINSTAKTYKGTTHIYSTDNVGSNKEIRYIKDIEIMMNK